MKNDVYERGMITRKVEFTIATTVREGDNGELLKEEIVIVGVYKPREFQRKYPGRAVMKTETKMEFRNMSLEDFVKYSTPVEVERKNHENFVQITRKVYHEGALRPHEVPEH